MDLFDDTIEEIKAWFEAKSKSGQSRRFFLPPGTTSPVLSDDRSDRRNGRIVLKEDTRVELGHPSLGSCSATLATHRSDLVSDGGITLIGPEIFEAQDPRLPFAQIIMAALEKSSGIEDSSQATLEIEDTTSVIDRLAHRYAQTDGYMIRSLPNLIWARVSQEAFQAGFSLKELGERLITAIKQRCTPVTACEVFFVTSSKKDVNELDDLMEKAREKRRKLETYAVGSDGEFECTQEINCTVCSEQTVCDTIREVIRIRKGDRVVTIREEESPS